MSIDHDEEFEGLLKEQCVREIPAEWRSRIMPRLHAAPAWPGPLAWRALAACWVVILGLHVLTWQKSPIPAMAQASGGVEREILTYRLAWALIDSKGSGVSARQDSPIRRKDRAIP